MRLLPAWKEAFMVYPVTHWGRQWSICKDKLPASKVIFDNFKKKGVSLKDQDLISHFSGTPHYSKKFLPQSAGGGEVNAIWGSLGMSLRQSQGIVKYLAWDCDRIEDVDLWHEKVKPQLQDWDIEWIEEYSGLENEKAHFFIRTPGIEVKYTSALFNQIRDNAGAEDKDWFNEQFPHGSRINHLFRLPFGLYLKGMTVNWGNVCGEDFDNLQDGMEAFINLKPLTEEKLLTLLSKEVRERKVYVAPETVYLESRKDLFAPADLPDFVRKLSSQCQAIHYGLNNPELLNDKTGMGHDLGLYIGSLARVNDQMNSNNEGLEWYEKYVDKARASDPSGHNWKYYWNSNKSSRIAGCKTWEELLGKCKGCPFKDKIKGPRQLYTAEELNKIKIGDIKIDSLENIRLDIFPKLEAFVDGLLASGTSADILVESVTGSGKSFVMDALSVKWAKEGKYIAIACNSTDVALEHKARIEWYDPETKLKPTGVKAFFMGSYEAIFEKFSGDIICPNAEAIKDCRSLGMESSYYKKKYCKECPFLEECNYPNQYSQVRDDKYHVVILQHSHFGSIEIVNQMFRNKHFDVLIVDEDPTGQLTTQLIPTAKEIEILKAFEDTVEWVPKLVKWLEEGNYPDFMIKPNRNDLKPIMEAFRKELVPYRLNDLLRQYNDGSFLHPSTGVMKFSPLPVVPIRILTDATPDIRELQIYLNNPNIIRIGKGVVCDPKIYHPDNKICQILDGRTSKAEMIGKEKLYEYLEFIGDKMMNEYVTDTALITVFKPAEQDTWDWLIRNYPTIVPRICVNHMAVGTNEFAKYNIQFVLAGPYMSVRMFKEATYKLKFVLNYWRRINDLPLINNPYPSQVGHDAKGEYYTEPVRRNHRDGIYEYPQYQVVTPDPESYEYLVWKKLQGKKAQAVRIRQKAGKKSITYIFDNGPMDNFLIDEVFCENDVLAYLRVD